MHTVTQYAPLAIMLALGSAADWWNKRPARRARRAALSLREKIARNIRTQHIAIAFQAGWLALFAGLYLSGLLDFHSWLSGTIAAGVLLAANLYLLHHTLAARRAYNQLGPLAYLAEVQHAFGTSAPSGSDQPEVPS